MALVFPPSFPSWVYHWTGRGVLVQSPEDFAALNPAEFADHPNDFDRIAPGFDHVPASGPEPIVPLVVPVVDETPAQIVDDPLIDVVDVPFVQTEPEAAPVDVVMTVTPPTPDPVVIVPVKRGPGRPRKVQA